MATRVKSIVDFGASAVTTDATAALLGGGFVVSR